MLLMDINLENSTDLANRRYPFTGFYPRSVWCILLGIFRTLVWSCFGPQFSASSPKLLEIIIVLGAMKK